MSREDHLKKLIANYSRRLEKLQEEQALHGLDTNPKILIEIEDIEAKLQELQVELQIFLDKAEATIQKTHFSASDHSSNKAAKESENLVVTWETPGPTADVILGNAEYSVLLVGTSNFRMVHDDLFHYHDWLRKDQCRNLGLLFLNPHSPHAFRRGRKDVQRSRQRNIAKAVRTAYREFKHNPRFIPAVYDGPYRYSARGVDISPNWTSSASSIEIFSSSHLRGISAGFHIHLKPNGHSDPFSFYQKELLDIWKNALANPPGHGVSLVSRWSTPPDAEELENLAQNLLKQLKLSKTDYHIFSSDQLHVTLTSLCRTQEQIDAAPLGLKSNNSAGDLPPHFLAYIDKVKQTLAEIVPNHLEFEFNRLILDERGYFILAPDENKVSPSIKAINNFLTVLSGIIDEFNQQYPDEQWNQRLEDGTDYRFRPKFTNYFPHVTIGRAFDYSNSLPIPLNPEKDKYIQIPTPLEFSSDRGSFVHYAYRSLLRCVGEIPVHFTEQSMLDPIEVVRLLRL
ncbi:MAG: hypothetical protein JXM69_12675 [Anaerolineae bacterium]|nr:hypothetical protein [Anaerolineae bacterium]